MIFRFGMVLANTVFSIRNAKLAFLLVRHVLHGVVAVLAVAPEFRRASCLSAFLHVSSEDAVCARL